MEQIMISPLYLAMSSVYMAHLWLPEYAPMVEKGKFSKARILATDAIKNLSDPLAISHMYQAAADMSILLNEYEKAEELYGRSIYILDGSEFLPIMSCRATGIIAIAQNRLEVGTQCFKRNTQQKISINKKIEAFGVLAMLFREAGLNNASNDSMMQMKEISETIAYQHWQPLVRLIEIDLSIFKSIYESPAMEDHIFRSLDNKYEPKKDEVNININESGNAPVIEKVLYSIIECRKRQLLNLKSLKNGEYVDFNHIIQFSFHPFVCQSIIYQRYSLLEIGLAAITGRQKNIINELVTNYPWMNYKNYRNINNSLRIDLNERLYFFAKTQNENGDTDYENNFYLLYIERAFKAIHQFTNKIQRLVRISDINNEGVEFAKKYSKQKGYEKKSEEIPIKCQIAINYILKNQARTDVSVYEVAAVAGVSERWLQLKFKNHYGYTPKKIIQMGRELVLS